MFASRQLDRRPVGGFLRIPMITRLCHIGPALLLLVAIAGTAAAQQAPAAHANWELSDKFSAEALRPAVYSSNITPRWIDKSDSMWYNWKDHTGSTFYLVVPAMKVKKPLFDHAKLAAQLSTESHQAHDATALPFTTITFSKDHKEIEFNADSSHWAWTLASETLRRTGPATPDTGDAAEGRGARGGGGGGGRGGRGGNFRNYSPDSTAFVFARDYNLFIVDVAKKDTLQISKDGEKDRSFGSADLTTDELIAQIQQDTAGRAGRGGGGGRGGRGGRGGGGAARETRVRANVVWSPDSKAFAVTREDERKVGDSYLVNVLANPRPALVTFKYAMAGEENVPQPELYTYRRGDPVVTPLSVAKWKDQKLSDLQFTTGSDKLRLVRTARTYRELEYIEVNLQTKAITPLIYESYDKGPVRVQPARYLKPGGDFIWSSQRSGWAHYYLYDHSGKLKNAITTGQWRTERIVELDSVKGVLWVSGVGREPGEDPYYSHLYRVNVDGTGFTLLDAGDATHTSTLSPSKKYIVDSYSRIDLVPKTVIRDSTGKVTMDLETQDVSKLQEMGWKPPETFHVKAADGVTDLYGVMFKPFDFDSTKKYPIIESIYPGPQTEQITFTFAPTAPQQRLAQLGFIVIEIGNRGGSPQRSLEYESYGYRNLRDYGLADKKAGAEQLAAQHKWIDLDRVGIYGHSGGGFMTAAAMLVPPYNEFFKVGVSESGNHDNNIYGYTWAEQYHGIDEVDAAGKVIAEDSSAFDDSNAKFRMHVPTTVEMAPNLKGNLLLETGDMDNNVHPGNTIRLVNALIKNNKRFDFMVFPGMPHGYGTMQAYSQRLMLEYFAEHLLGDYNRTNATYDHAK